MIRNFEKVSSRQVHDKRILRSNLYQGSQGNQRSNHKSQGTRIIYGKCFPLEESFDEDQSHSKGSRRNLSSESILPLIVTPSNMSVWHVQSTVAWDRSRQSFTTHGSRDFHRFTAGPAYGPLDQPLMFIRSTLDIRCESALTDLGLPIPGIKNYAFSRCQRLVATEVHLTLSALISRMFMYIHQQYRRVAGKHGVRSYEKVGVNSTRQRDRWFEFSQEGMPNSYGSFATRNWMRFYYKIILFLGLRVVRVQLLLVTMSMQATPQSVKAFRNSTKPLHGPLLGKNSGSLKWLKVNHSEASAGYTTDCQDLYDLCMTVASWNEIYEALLTFDAWGVKDDWNKFPPSSLKKFTQR